MASNRDRARERQERRRRERSGPVDDPRELLRQEAEARAGAPPEDVGSSDRVSQYEQDIESSAYEDEHYDPSIDSPDDQALPIGPGENDVEDNTTPAEHANKPRFVQFMIAVRAELARVQWPDRQALTTLTGVVLGFVVIAGSYLGALDALFAKIISWIL